MSVVARTQLLQASIPEQPNDPNSVRHALRRGAGGLEFFAARWTREVDGEQEFHGYPTAYVGEPADAAGDIVEPLIRS
jgi:hypothetical protein